VQRSIVLLDNHGGALPISHATTSILVAGAGADDIGLQSGGWTITHQGSSGATTIGTTILQGITAAAGPGTDVRFDPSGTFADQEPADLGIVVLAESPYAEGLGDRADLTLPATDRAVLDRMRQRVAKLVVVLVSGRPLVVTDEIAGWDAFVAAWLPGSEGEGVADVLFGDVPFTGRLPYAWPRATSQLPFSDSATLTAACDGPLFARGFAAADRSAPLLDCPGPPAG
jgi:beta-glucosidase